MLWWLLACGPSSEIPSVQAQRGDLEVALSFKGELKARESVDIVNPLEGRSEVAFVVDDGANVEAGDVIVEFETEEALKKKVELEAKREVAQTKVESARAKLRIDLGQAEAKRVEAELDAELAQLRKTDSLTVPRVERERSRIAALQSKMSIESSDAGVRRLKMNAGADIQLLELEVLEATLDIESADRRIARSTIKAPAPGVAMIEEHWDGKIKAGDTLWMGTTVAKLPDVRALDVIGWVHEVDSPVVEVGQRAMLSMDAQRGKSVEAVVKTVDPVVLSKGDSGEKHLRIVLEPDSLLEAMKPGMTVEIELRVAALADVVLLPEEAVFFGPEGPFVYLEGAPHGVIVTAEGEGKVAVEGLDEGASVLLFDPEAWSRGERPAGET